MAIYIGTINLEKLAQCWVHAIKAMEQCRAPALAHVVLRPARVAGAVVAEVKVVVARAVSAPAVVNTLVAGGFKAIVHLQLTQNAAMHTYVRMRACIRIHDMSNTNVVIEEIKKTNNGWVRD